MARKYKRGQEVMYYGVRGVMRCYFGGKMGAYRVLSSTPYVDTGWAVPLSEVETSVFPAPNEQGVFDRQVCDVLEYRVDSRFFVRIEYLQAGPALWAIGQSLQIGNNGRSIPVSTQLGSPTFEDAIKSVLPMLLVELARLAAGVDNPFDRSVAPNKPRKTTQRRAQDAIYHLLNALPSELCNDIVMSLSGENGESDG
jgi:hypothetical protein